jgi:PAS domain-containing protein
MKNTFTIDQLLEGLGPIIFESIKIPFGIIDINHKVLWANEALASLHQVSSNELIGNICYQVCRGRTESCKDCPTQTVFKTGKIQIVEN